MNYFCDRFSGHIFLKFHLTETFGQFWELGGLCELTLLGWASLNCQVVTDLTADRKVSVGVSMSEMITQEQCDPQRDAAFYHLALSEPGATYCNSTFDSFSCWPTTKGGDVAETACPDISIANPNSEYRNSFCLWMYFLLSFECTYRYSVCVALC